LDSAAAFVAHLERVVREKNGEPRIHCGPPAAALCLHREHIVFVFFSNRLGCGGSILVSVVLSALLILLMRACSSTY
jgi:hypothetical protein